MADLAFQLSGIPLRLRGLPPTLADGFSERWGAYRVDAVERAWLDLTVRVAGVRLPPGPQRAKEMTIRVAGRVTRYETFEGLLDLAPDGTGEIELRPGLADQEYYALVNLVTAALARVLPAHAIVELHAAGIVIDGRAFVLIGPAGSGKSTWAGAARAAGAVFLSDDIVFVDTAPAAPEALALPIRGDWPLPQGPARWPLAALLLPRHGPVPALTPVSRLAVASRLAANLPYVAERLEQDDGLQRALTRLASEVPARELTFAPDASYLELLRGFSLRGD